MWLCFQTNDFFFSMGTQLIIFLLVPYLFLFSLSLFFFFCFSFSFGFLFDLLVFYSTGVCCTTLQQTLRCMEF
jgi:hypothetical protein